MKPLLFILCLVTFSSQAQELFWEYGPALTKFDYKNSQGNELDNLQGKTFSYVNVGTRIPLLKENLQFTGTLNLNRFGAIGSDASLNNFFEWETTYFGAQIGVDVKVVSAGNFSWHFITNAGPEFLIQGNQTLNNQVFNLKNSDDFKSPIFLFNFGTLFQYKVSPDIALSLSYQYGLTNTIDGGSINVGTEELSFKTHQFGVGMYFNIASKNKDEVSPESSTNNENQQP